MIHPMKSRYRPNEKHEPMPADGALCDFKYESATTISTIVRSTPDMAWPWLAQIGRGGGYYAFDFITNSGCPSADYLLDIPEPRAGDKCALLGATHIVNPGVGLAWIKITSHMFHRRSGRTVSYKVAPSGSGSVIIARFATGADCFISLAGAKVAILAATFLIRRQLNTLRRMINSYPVRKATGNINRSISPQGHQRDTITFSQTAKPIPSAKRS